MKKFLIVAAMIAASVTLSAQQKGDFSVGGALGVGGGSNSEKYTVTANGGTQSDKSSEPTTTNFILAPMFNYFVIDNLELSAGIRYNMTRDFWDKDDNNKNLYSFNHMVFGVIGAHYYIPLIQDKLYYTPGVEFGFGGGSYVRPDYNNNNEPKTDKVPFTFAFNADLGKFEFKATDNIGISANLFCLNVTTSSDKTSESGVTAKMSATNFSAGLNYGITLGVKYYF